MILAETITIFLSHETTGKKIKDSYWVRYALLRQKILYAGVV